MSWLKVSDRALADPRFTRVSRDARYLHLEALAWALAYGDGEGLIASHSLRRATDADDPVALAGELVAAGIWTATDDGWRIGFMLEDQLAPDEIARQRAFNRARQERHRRHSQGDHTLCDPRFCNAVRNASHNGAVTTPRLDPTRPKGGTKVEARSAAAPPGGSAGRSARRGWTPEQKARAAATRIQRKAEEQARRDANAQAEAELFERSAAEERQRVEAQAQRDAEWETLTGRRPLGRGWTPITEAMIAEARAGLPVQQRKALR